MDQMNFENFSKKQLSDLEQRVRELLATIKKVKLHDEQLVTHLKLLEQQIAQVRCERYDAVNSEYHTY